MPKVTCYSNEMKQLPNVNLAIIKSNKSKKKIVWSQSLLLLTKKSTGHVIN